MGLSDFIGIIIKNWSTILILGSLYYGFIAFLKRRQYVKKANKLPSLKLKFFHVFGHVQLLLFHRLKKFFFGEKGHIPLHVADFIALVGYSYVFPKKSVSLIWQFYKPFVNVYKANAAEIILNHSTELKKAWFYRFLDPWLGINLLTSSGEEWRRRRKLLTPAFHFNILKDFQFVFNKQAAILVDALKKHADQEFVDVVPFISRCSLDILCESVLGKELNSQTEAHSPYLNAVSHLTGAVLDRMQSPWIWPEVTYNISQFRKNFDISKLVTQTFTDEMIFAKKKEKMGHKELVEAGIEIATGEKRPLKKRALLDLLLDEHINNDSISETEIREEIETFTFEGHDTTSMSMSWTLYLIGLHPWIQDRVHLELDHIFDGDDREATVEDLKDMKYLECVIKESLRLYPPVPVIGRELKDDLEMDGHVIPKGSSCVVFTYMLHRDPEVFPNPEKFDPERFMPENSTGRHPFAFVPFSAGPRNCIGQRFALMEEKTVLSSILRSLQVRSLDPRDRVLIADEVVLRPAAGLRLQIRHRDQDFQFPDVYYTP